MPKDIKILVVEDDEIDQISMRVKLEQLGFQQPHITDYRDDLDSLFDTINPRLVISDIYFNKKPLGLSLIEACRLRKIPLILITADTRFSTYDMAKQDELCTYLVKPFHQFTLQSSIDLLLKAFKNSEDPVSRFILIRDYNGKKNKIALKDILYVEAEGNFCRIHCMDTFYMVKKSLRMLSSELDTGFVQVHKSFLINRDHVTRFSNHDIMINNVDIPVGRKFKKNLDDVFKTKKENSSDRN